MRWRDLKKKGSGHYKAIGVEPIDLLKAGGILHGFAIGSIIKYAFRNRATPGSKDVVSISDMKKIIHYAEMLISIEEERAMYSCNKAGEPNDPREDSK
jgi:hypothetical protein